MQFIDLKKQQLRIRDNIENRISSVLAHGKYIMGPEVNELEEKLATFVGVKNCITCSSGTDALLMSLIAKGVGVGDAVFVTTFSFIASAEVISLLGATPIFIDIDPKTFNISPAGLKEAINKVRINSNLTPKAVIAVDIFGLPADYNSLEKICRDSKVFVIEDGAQSLGGKINNRMVGSFGNMGTTSFFPAKPLGCYGDGGAIFTDDNKSSELLKSIRVHGKGHEKYDNIRIGINGRLDTIQAAILLEKLSIFPEEIEMRNEVADNYHTHIGDFLETQEVSSGYKSAWAQFSLLANSESDRNSIMDALKMNGIPSVIYYPRPLHLQTAFSYLGYKVGDLPISEDISKRIFSLPMHPYLEIKSIIKISKILREFK